MKQFFKIVLLIILAIIILCLSFVISKNAFSNNYKEKVNTGITENSIDKNRIKNNIAKKIDDSKDYIYEKDSKLIKEKVDSEDYEDNIRLPFINIDSSDAKKTNEELQNRFNVFSNSLEKDDYGFNYTKMDYEEHIINNKYVSLSVLRMPIFVPGGDFLEYYTIYNFDLENSGKLLSRNDIIKKFNITESELESKIKDELISMYNEYDFPEMDLGTLDEYLSNSKYEFSSIELLITGENTLDVYCEYPIGPEGVRMGVVSIKI